MKSSEIRQDGNVLIMAVYLSVILREVPSKFFLFMLSILGFTNRVNLDKIAVIWWAYLKELLKTIQG